MAGASLRRRRGWWRSAFLFAWRDARRHRGRSLLVALVVGLPVFLAVLVDVGVQSARLEPRDIAGVELGSRAAARVTAQDPGARIAQSPDGARVTRLGRNDPDVASAALARLSDLLPPGRRLPVTTVEAAQARVDGRVLPVAVTEVDYADPGLAGWVTQVVRRPAASTPVRSSWTTDSRPLAGFAPGWRSRFGCRRPWGRELCGEK